MTGKLVCPVGPETKLEALPTNQELELFGVCVAHMDSDLKLSNLEVWLCQSTAHMMLHLYSTSFLLSAWS